MQTILFAIALFTVALIAVIIGLHSANQDSRETLMFREAMDINMRIKKLDTPTVSKELGDAMIKFFLTYSGKVDNEKLIFLNKNFETLIQMKIRFLRLRESMYESRVQARESAIIDRMHN